MATKKSTKKKTYSSFDAPAIGIPLPKDCFLKKDKDGFLTPLKKSEGQKSKRSKT